MLLHFEKSHSLTNLHTIGEINSVCDRTSYQITSIKGIGYKSDRIQILFLTLVI